MTNVYEKVTADIISAIEKGVAPWTQPWFGVSKAVSHTNGKPYSLINQMLLGKAGEWLTFNQIQSEGGHIKKDCKAHYVVFWKFLPKYGEDENGEKVIIGQFPLLKFYNVWHIDECEGIKAKYEAKVETHNKPIEAAQKIFADYVERESENGLKAKFSDYEDSAYFRPCTDTIVLPSLERFLSSEGFYATLFHETTHSTGAKHRLNREGVANFDKFGSERYSKEELIAEIGSAFLCNLVGISTEGTFENTASYIKGWLKPLKDDPKMILSAASKAEQAVNYILTGEKPNE